MRCLPARDVGEVEPDVVEPQVEGRLHQHQQVGVVHLDTALVAPSSRAVEGGAQSRTWVILLNLRCSLLFPVLPPLVLLRLW